MNDTDIKIKPLSDVSGLGNSSAKKAQSVAWHSASKVVCCINSYPNGITFSTHVRGKFEEEEGMFGLRIKDTRNYLVADGNYYLYKKNIEASLEKHLSRLHKKGLLGSCTVYLGTTVDPFASFHRRFDTTNTCLELLKKYAPQKLVIQTRSPMVIAVLPSLKDFGDSLVVSIPIESNKESSIAKYTPGQPKISQRLLAAQGLRGQGVAIHLSVGPVLPYGDVTRDAWDFAELLERYGDSISLSSLATGKQEDEKVLKSLAISKRLESDGEFHFLRPQAHKALEKALQTIAPEKLVLPVDPEYRPSQMTLFAA